MARSAMETRPRWRKASSGPRPSPPHGTRAFQFAAFAYVVFGLLDCVTTAMALARGGREGNQLAASIYADHGLLSLFAFKAVVVAFIIAVLVWLPRRLAAWVTTVFA